MSVPHPAPSSPERSRFLSEADCHDIVQRLARFAKGGGYTAVTIQSSWTGNVRWGRNQISTSGEVRNNMIRVYRNLNGASQGVTVNDTSDAALVAAARRAERVAALHQEAPQSDLIARLPLEPTTAPPLFSEATYQLDAAHRAAAAVALAKAAAAVGMLSAGYIEVSAHSMAVLDTLGRVRYFPYTHARYSVTVRDSRAQGSGWAGVDDYQWSRIDAAKLTAQALDKCLTSRHPVRIEPGRYMTILEPQAVCDFIGPMVYGGLGDRALERNGNESSSNPGPFFKVQDTSMLGDRVVDERITLSADPMDAELGFPPFNAMGTDGPDSFTNPVYHPVTWIDRGVLTNLAYDRAWAIGILGQDTGLPNSGSFRMSGGEMSIEEMIATTRRGLLVTRFVDVLQLNFRSLLYRGYTRDGLWLIEQGKISHPVMNLAFTESILFALNNVEQLGVSQRTFHRDPWWSYSQNPQPVMVPALKIKDFSFTSLVDAV